MGRNISKKSFLPRTLEQSEAKVELLLALASLPLHSSSSLSLAHNLSPSIPSSMPPSTLPSSLHISIDYSPPLPFSQPSPSLSLPSPSIIHPSNNSHSHPTSCMYVLYSTNMTLFWTRANSIKFRLYFTFFAVFDQHSSSLIILTRFFFM